MILLDTNVISEPTRAQPNATVVAWLNQQPREILFLSSITQAEMLFGLALLPAGRRKDAMVRVAARTLEQFDGHILPFDSAAASHYARLAVAARTAGRTLPTTDGYIAAVAAAHGMAVATRDVGPFIAAGVRVINPWTAGPPSSIVDQLGMPAMDDVPFEPPRIKD